MSEETILNTPPAAPVEEAPEPTAPVEAVEQDQPEAPASDDVTEGDDQITPPETYADFVTPEGVEVDSALLESALPLFKELGLTQEQAQKLVDFQAQQVQANVQRQNDSFTQLKDDWLKQSKSDKEFGGDKFDENVGAARTALEKFGTPELKEMLDAYGIGNNPEMIRFMVRVGKHMGEDVPGNGSPTTVKKDRVSTLYPTA